MEKVLDTNILVCTGGAILPQPNDGMKWNQSLS